MWTCSDSLPGRSCALAAFQLGVLEDVGLPIAGLITIAVLVGRHQVVAETRTAIAK